jgi:replicative DNA helicase
METRAKIWRMWNKPKLGLIIIDYLLLLTSSDSKILREQLAEILVV